MKLSEYIEQVGDEEAAKVLSVQPRTATSWRLGQRKPSPDKAHEIVEKTGGAVSFIECYPKSA